MSKENSETNSSKQMLSRRSMINRGSTMIFAEHAKNIIEDHLTVAQKENLKKLFGQQKA